MIWRLPSRNSAAGGQFEPMDRRGIMGGQFPPHDPKRYLLFLRPCIDKDTGMSRLHLERVGPEFVL